MGGPNLFAIRVYAAALTMAFLLCSLMTARLGTLQGVVLVCALLYSILDVREDLHDLRRLEIQVASLSAN